MQGLRSITQRIITDALSGLRGGSLAVALSFLLIVTVFVIPLPWYVLDVLIATNIAISLTLLLRSIFRRDNEVFDAFPAILLITTLYRLALNVSSTRLILLYGDQDRGAAGQVIQSFGEFVVQGDFVVGAIVFVVIATVNFLVVARGSARVAEVAARFSLDSLPGKQLAIDADLRSGSITREEAERRREGLTRETRFYGAMDGAMKFVQGDAIAGIVIAFVCAIGGVSLGISRGMEIAEAISTFGVLTIGDGLVSIIPSLLISVCAGVVVTQVGGRGSVGTGDAIAQQIVAEPRALTLAALSFIALSLTRGLPFLPFFTVGILLLALFAYRTFDGTKRARFDTRDGNLGAGDSAEPQIVRGLILEIDSTVLEPYFNSAAVREAWDQAVSAQAKRVVATRGFPLPALSVVKNRELSAGSYRILVREQVMREGSITPDAVFAAIGAAALQVFGAAVLQTAYHPIDHRSGAWITADPEVGKAIGRLGAEVLAPYQFLILEATGAAFDAIGEIFGLDETRTLIDNLKRDHPALVQEVFDRGLLSVPELTEVLRRLVRERVTIRDLKLILEGVTEFSALAPDKEDRSSWLMELHGFLRRVLSRSIVSDAVGSGRKLRGFILAPDLEEEFRAAVSGWDGGRTRPVLEPDLELALRTSAGKMFLPVLERGALPVVVLCAGDIRRAVHEFFSEQLSSAEWLRTLAFEELDSRYRPESVGVLSVK